MSRPPVAIWRRWLAKAQVAAVVIGLASTSLGVWSLLARQDDASSSPVDEDGVLAMERVVAPTASDEAPAATSTSEAPSPSTSAAPAPTTTSEARATTTTTSEVQAASTTTAAPVPVDNSVSCANTTLGYVLTYSMSWSTAARDVAEECRFFHPEPFTVPAEYEVAEVAITIESFAVDFDDMVATFEGPDIDIADRRDLTVAGGARAVRFAFSFAGDPPGVVSVAYIVDRGVDVLYLSAHHPFSPDFAETEIVLEAMVASLELFG